MREKNGVHPSLNESSINVLMQVEKRLELIFFSFKETELERQKRVLKKHLMLRRLEIEKRKDGREEHTSRV